MSRRKPRGLNPDEKELWSRVTETAVPIRTSQTLFVDKPVTVPAPKTVPTKLQKFQIGQKAKPTQTAVPAPQTPVAMDKKAFGKMKRGKISPDATIDLHGMTQEQAHPALVSTILNAHAAGKRLVLVVTGKGKVRDDGGPIPVRTGILKHAVPQWLRQAPLNAVILQTNQASQNHGGSGALYVYLRRKR
ncbi:Smr/MutS family protein [uncultured Litoreibacter sp.]|uniref:Smr/MutS family protein n=1 Tax=uncultured Litoreibacter sp. TaxID=1392394 RepID=UPI002616CD90|nr:Smr/MutS family protein [uncultured Litoreibacter sp.]